MSFLQILILVCFSFRMILARIEGRNKCEYDQNGVPKKCKLEETCVLILEDPEMKSSDNKFVSSKTVAVIYDSADQKLQD